MHMHKPHRDEENECWVWRLLTWRTRRRQIQSMDRYNDWELSFVLTPTSWGLGLEFEHVHTGTEQAPIKSLKHYANVASLALGPLHLCLMRED